MSGGANNRANAVVGAIVAAVVVVAVAAFAFMQMGAAPAASGTAAQLRAVVHDADGRTYELPLAQDGETTVTTSLGTNVVAVEGGSVFVREADCDNHDCMRQGAISAPGRQIICLPHKLWIEIVAADGQGGEMDVDAVAGDGSTGDLDALAR